MVNVTSIFFALAFATSSFTLLRLPGLPVGVSEVLLAVAVILAFLSGGKIGRKFLYFDLLLSFLFFALTLGYFYSVYLGLDEIGKSAHDYASFLVCFVSLIAFQFHVSKRPPEDFIRHLSNAMYVSLVFLFFLAFLYWSSVGRFSGLSKNPNQLALFCILGLMFLSLDFYFNDWTRSRLVGSTALAFGLVFIGWISGSDAFRVSLFFCVFVLFVETVLLDKRGRVSALGFVFFVFFILSILVFFQDIYEYLSSVITEISEDGGQGSVRYTLWINGVLPLLDSPLIGYGPGAWSGLHEPLEGHEAHNTLIDFANSAGIIASVMLFGMIGFVFVRLFKKRARLLSATLVLLIVFSMFHYVLRSPFVWVVLLMFYWVLQ